MKRRHFLGIASGTTCLPFNAVRAEEDRSVAEVFRLLSQHYGENFKGSYIEALAAMARKQRGDDAGALGLAKEYAESHPEIPINGGRISGTLLYTAIDSDWARNRVVAAADLAFDDSGKPLAAMPSHKEMSDAVFMGGPILAHAGTTTGDSRYYDQCLRHIEYIQTHCLRDDGLYRHSPLADVAWGRGNGFPALGIAMVLETMPDSHPAHEELRGYLSSHLNTLLSYQSDDGRWHQVIDESDSFLEFTSTCMISYALLYAVRSGLLEESQTRPAITRAWAAIERCIGTDGLTIESACESTGKLPNLQAYLDRKASSGRDDRGGAMALIFAESLLRTPPAAG